eukprot:UN09721
MRRLVDHLTYHFDNKIENMKLNSMTKSIFQKNLIMY